MPRRADYHRHVTEDGLFVRQIECCLCGLGECRILHVGDNTHDFDWAHALFAKHPSIAPTPERFREEIHALTERILAREKPARERLVDDGHSRSAPAVGCRKPAAGNLTNAHRGKEVGRHLADHGQGWFFPCRRGLSKHRERLKPI